MNTFRKTIVGASATLLTVVLFVVCAGWSIYHTVGTAGPLKESLKQSGFYNALVSSALADASLPGISQKPADDPVVKKIISDAFPPTYLESQTDSAVDSLYAWIHGKTPHLNLRIDYTDPAQEIVTGLTGYADSRLSQLPQCTTSEEAAAQVGKAALALTCLPPNINRAAAVETIRTQLTAKGGPFHSTVYTGADLKDGNGQSLEQTLRGAPELHREVRTFLVTATLFSLALAAAIVFAAANRLKGLNTLSIVVFISGCMITGLGLIASTLATKLAESAAVSTQGESALTAPVVKAMSFLIEETKTGWIGTGVFLAVISAATLITLYTLKKRKKRHDEVHGDVSFSHTLNESREGALNDTSTDSTTRKQRSS